jgi:hypothetical protein
MMFYGIEPRPWTLPPWQDGQITTTIPNDAQRGSPAVLRIGLPEEWREARLFFLRSPMRASL